MAINKEKNVNVQITIPKEDFENLKTLVEAFNAEGIKVTKSIVLVQGLRIYIKQIVSTGSYLESEEGKQLFNKIKQEAEARKEKKDA